MHPNQKQHGFILLTLLLVVVVSGSAIVFSMLSSRTQTVLAQDQEVREELQAAKAALLAYAANTPSMFGIGPGHLPCPDLNNDGLPAIDCEPDTQYLGRLPVYALHDPYDLDSRRFYISSRFADTDEQFWYAVSPAFIHSSKQIYALNNISPTELTLDNKENIVALIIAPGEELDTQNRSGNPNSYTEYLDGLNGPTEDFYTAYTNNPELFNDKIVAITRGEILEIALPKVISAIKTQLDLFHQNYELNYGYFGHLHDTYPVYFWFRAENWLTLSIEGPLPANSPTPDWLVSDSWVNTDNANQLQNSIQYYPEVYTDPTETPGKADRAVITFSGCNANFSYTIDFNANPGITQTGSC